MSTRAVERPALRFPPGAGFSLPPECCYHVGPQRNAEPSALPGPCRFSQRGPFFNYAVARQGQFPCYAGAAARPCIPSQSAVERPARTQIRAGLLLRCRVDYNDIVASAYAMVTVAGVARRVGDSGARASLCRLIAAIMVPPRGCQAEG